MQNLISILESLDQEILFGRLFIRLRNGVNGSPPLLDPEASQCGVGPDSDPHPTHSVEERREFADDHGVSDYHSVQRVGKKEDMVVWRFLEFRLGEREN